MLSQVCFCEMSLTSFCLNFQTESWRFFSAEQMQDSKPGLAASCLMLPSATRELPTRLRLSSLCPCWHVAEFYRHSKTNTLKEIGALMVWCRVVDSELLHQQNRCLQIPASVFSIFWLPALIRTRNLMRIDGIMGGLHLQWSYSFSPRHFLQET